jgi:undecaprenyl-diphosphatase
LVNAVAGTKWGIVPKLSADLDSERESLYQDLVVSGKIRPLGKKQLVQPQIGTNFIGDQFFTDGKAYIISLL